MLLILRLLGCDGTPIWWRRAKFSSSTAARERKIKDRVARNVVREMSIGENYERKITLIGSDISRFSRGTEERDYRLIWAEKIGLGFELPNSAKKSRFG